MDTIRSLAVATAVLAGLMTAPAYADTDLELKVKAAFLYNFARYFAWPAGKFTGPSDPVRICVLEPDPFGSVLEESLSGKTVNDHPIAITRSSRMADFKDCHLVYSSATDAATAESQFSQLAGAHVVTVHETERAVSGGVVRFFRESRKVRFEINTLAAARENLELSLKLQNLAVTVRK